MRFSVRPAGALMVTLVCLTLTQTANAGKLLKLIETSKGTAVYVDPDAIDRTDTIRKVSELWTFLEPNQFGDLSSRIDAEYDCPNESRRITRVTGYEAQMGQGKASSTRENPDKTWHHIDPNQLMAAVFRGVCLK
jgi:hypothetical protein